MSRWYKPALLGLALVLMGLSVNRYISEGSVDWFSLIIAIAALILLGLNIIQKDES